MKVCDVPEMDYFAKDDVGEVSLCINTRDQLLQGYCNVMKDCDVPEMDYYAKDDKGEVSLCISTGDQLPWEM